VLLNANDGQSLPVQAGATTFAFHNIPFGSTYVIAVSSQPSSPAQACTVYGGTGVAGSSSPSITIECTSNFGRLGGTITGLVGSGLELVQSNGDVVNPAAGDTAFQFMSPLWPGTRYSVGVSLQPVNPAQTCTIRRGKGRMADASGVLGDVAIECVENATSPLSGTYGFETVSRGKGYMTFFPNGTYSYVARVDNPSCGSNNGNGIEYGVYRWEAGSGYDPGAVSGHGAFSIVSAVVDTNGICGLASAANGPQVLLSGTLDRSAGTLEINTGSEVLTLTAIESVPNRVIGSFEPGSGGAIESRGDGIPVERVSGAFTVFVNDGTYVSVESQDAPGIGEPAGAEWGCAAWSPNELDQDCYFGDPRLLDLNGRGGLSERFQNGYGAINLALCGEYLCMDKQSGSGYLEEYWSRILPE